MTTVALITTSKGRLHHIRETLPLMAAQGADEVIVVDYGCPDGTGTWVAANFPAVSVVRLPSETARCPARARNAGAARARSEWLAFIDADIMLAPDWLGWLRAHLENGHFYWAATAGDGSRSPDLFGTLVCRRADFEAIGGYDEVFSGWAGEDTDLVERLLMHDVREAHFPAEMVREIPHSDGLRAGWEGLATRDQKLVLTDCYKAAKQQTGTTLGLSGALPLELRQNLWNITKAAVTEWFAQGARTRLRIRYSLGRGARRALPHPYAMSSEVLFEFTLGPGKPRKNGDGHAAPPQTRDRGRAGPGETDRPEGKRHPVDQPAD